MHEMELPLNETERGSLKTPITVFCDGSSLGNPGAGGWCWYVEENCWQAGGRKPATNNLMELTAVQQFLQATVNVNRAVEICCDSKYVIDALSKWVWGWRKNGWKTSTGNQVANRELIQQTFDLTQTRTITWKWVKGHSGVWGNEQADVKARNFAEALKSGRPSSTGPGWND